MLDVWKVHFRWWSIYHKCKFISILEDLWLRAYVFFSVHMTLNRLVLRKCLFDVVVQVLSCVQLFLTPWAAACQASLSFTISWSLFRVMFIVLVMPSSHLMLCHPLLLSSVFPGIRVFSNELPLHIRWPDYWSFSFSISPSSACLVLIFMSYWMNDWMVGTLLKCQVIRKLSNLVR